MQSLVPLVRARRVVPAGLFGKTSAQKFLSTSQYIFIGMGTPLFEGFGTREPCRGLPIVRDSHYQQSHTHPSSIISTSKLIFSFSTLFLVLCTSISLRSTLFTSFEFHRLCALNHSNLHEKSWPWMNVSALLSRRVRLGRCQFYLPNNLAPAGLFSHATQHTYTYQTHFSGRIEGTVFLCRHWLTAVPGPPNCRVIVIFVWAFLDC